MGYSALATSIRSNANLLTDSVTSIKGLNFASVWKGAAGETLIGTLDQAVAKLSAEQAGLNFFASILDSVQKYKDNKEKLEAIEITYNNIPNTQENYDQKMELWGQIKQLYQENKALREAIISALASVDVDVLDVSVIAANMFIPTTYKFNVDELLAIYQSGKLRKLNDKESLYNYVSEEEVLAGLEAIKKQYSGREAAVNSALYILKVAADQGVKIDYHAHGTVGSEPYVPTKAVALGVDCNPFTSWVVDKGTTNGFQWRPVEGFNSVGQSIPYESWNKAQPGDVFVVTGDSGKHVGVIIENRPETGTFICAEASGQNVGIVLQTRTYSSMRNSGYKVKDMTNVYNNTENTDRSVFNDLVDWNTYQKKP